MSTAPNPLAETIQEEPTYTVAEIAAIWKISKDSVKRLFANEEGVLVFRPSFQRNTKRRAKVTLRIPKSVFDRVKHKHARVV